MIGRELRLAGRPRTVIGVMPASFDLTPESEELWVPAALTLTGNPESDFGSHFLWVRERPTHNAGRGANAVSWPDFFVGDSRQRLLVLLGAVTLVLVIACGNVANPGAAAG